MGGPQDLRESVQVDDLARILARMVCREAPMVCRMPVLCGYDQVEERLYPIGYGHDLIAFGHRQRAGRQEVVLNVHKDECVHGLSLRIPIRASLRLARLEDEFRPQVE